MANTIHDLGGMHGFGPVVREDEPHDFEHALGGPPALTSRPASAVPPAALSSGSRCAARIA